jgi:hypothetical protein
MKVIRKISPKGDTILIDGQRAKWVTMERRVDNGWMVRYQYLKREHKPAECKDVHPNKNHIEWENEVFTVYYTTAFQKKSPKGTKEETEFIQRIEHPTADWVLDRQVKRGVIV